MTPQRLSHPVRTGSHRAAAETRLTWHCSWILMRFNYRPRRLLRSFEFKDAANAPRDSLPFEFATENSPLSSADLELIWLVPIESP